jgi:hypothetical protein
MRWRLHVEEYSPDLQYIKGTHNVVEDALSCLEIEETPFEDTQESFLGLMECFAKKADTDELHPLNYQQLKNAQDKDKTIQRPYIFARTSLGEERQPHWYVSKKRLSFQDNFKSMLSIGITPLSVIQV